MFAHLDKQETHNSCFLYHNLNNNVYHHKNVLTLDRGWWRK